MITQNPNAHARATFAALEGEVEILNRYFRSARGEPLVRFTFKSASLYDDIAGSSCEVVRMGDAPMPWHAPDLLKACKDPRVVDPNAILVLVFDAWSEGQGFSHVDSMGGYFGERPYAMLDWERLGHTTQSPEEHEMGHAFGLAHVCVPGATNTTPTNIMASYDGCSGTGGLRNLGFDDAQVAIIRERSRMYQRTLGL